MDWVRTRSDEAAVDAGCKFDLPAAERVRFFFERFLHHSKGQFAGHKFELLDWQWEKIVAPLYGWKRPDGTRRFRRGGVGIPKKNGKSTIFAGLSIYGLAADDEPGAEVYSAAADREQAAIIYAEAANMVEASPELYRKLKVRRSGRKVFYPAKQALLKALSADVPTKEGLNIHYLLFDELHAQKTWDLWNTLRYGGAARRQPLFLWISTAGYDQASLCFAQWQYARDVLKGKTTDWEYLAVLYEPDEGDDWKDPAVWRKVNPSWGVTISESDMQSGFDQAVRSPVEENSFKRYRLNVWTQQQTRWLQTGAWDECAERYTFQEFARGRKVLAGFDLSSTSDVTALILLGKDKDKWRLWPVFWVPEQTLRRRERENKYRFDMWVKSGFVKTTPGDVVDYDFILSDFREMARRLNVREVCIDPWNATQFATDLQESGFKVVWVRQGYASLSRATKELERLVLGKQIAHPANPTLDWMVGNVAIEQDAAGNVKPSKRRSPEKIDGVSALVTALARGVEEPFNKVSKYEKEGLAHVESS